MPEETAVAVQGEGSTEVAMQKKDIPGMGQFDAEDMSIPFIRLIQPTSKVENGNPGQLINSATNQVMDKIEVVFIAFAKDWVTFKDPKTNVDKKPQRQYKFLAINQATKWPVIIAISSISSIIEAKKLLNAFWQNNLPMWTKVIEVSGERMSGKFGVYYKLNFKEVGDTESEVRENAAQFFEEHADSVLGKAEGTEGEDEPVEDVSI
jgi:hypothetical protein